MALLCEAIQDQRDFLCYKSIPCTHVQYLPRFNIELLESYAIDKYNKTQTTNESY